MKTIKKNSAENAALAKKEQIPFFVGYYAEKLKEAQKERSLMAEQLMAIINGKEIVITNEPQLFSD